MKMRVISFSVSPAMYATLKKNAYLTEKSLSAYLNEALVRHLERDKGYSRDFLTKMPGYFRRPKEVHMEQFKKEMDEISTDGIANV